MPKKIAIYTRISTTSDRQEVETQTLALENHCERLGWDIVARYSDEGSGAKSNRKDFLKLKKDALRRPFDTVLVFRFDRFARSTKELLDSLELFESLNIDFVSVREDVNTSTPMGKALFTMAGIFAELERSFASERIKAGLDRAKSKGKKLGRPSPRIMKKEEEILAMLQDGFSQKHTAKTLTVSKSHVQKVAKKRSDDLLQMNLIKKA